MNLNDLKNALTAAGISEQAYSFTSDGCGEVYRISRIHDLLGDGWEIYYAERGNKNRLLTFRSESEACTEFLRWISQDTTARLNQSRTKNTNAEQAAP